MMRCNYSVTVKAEAAGQTWYNNIIKTMVVQGNEAGNIYRHRIQLPQEENEAGRVSGNHG